MKKALLISWLVIGLFCHSNVSACSCIFLETFCASLGPSADQVYTDVIIYGRVISQQRDGIEVALIDVIYGQVEGSTYFINQGNGADCGMDTQAFDINKEYIFSMNEWQDENGSKISKVSICGINFLAVVNGKVIGPISRGVVQQEYADFRKGVSCGILQTLPKNPTPFIAFKVFPNPSSELLQIIFEDNYETIDITLIDMLGRVIWRATRREVQTGIPQIIDLSALQVQSGTYLLQTRNNDFLSYEKIVVARE